MLATLDTPTLLFFISCLVAVCAFEFVNGFHDTANAVATVIYTGTLKPRTAVVWSGIWNFLGVYAGGIAVAVGIIKLLPLHGMAAVPLTESIALLLAILLAAILWNLGTWYLGIPCSSSHTLIGSLLGAGIAFQWLHPDLAQVNWAKAKDIMLSLLVSPAFGFAGAIILMFILRYVLKSMQAIFQEPDPLARPPWWIRGVLVTTCTLVSFFHGSNDGQKGVGLLMIVLMTFLPLQFALLGGPEFDSATVRKTTETIRDRMQTRGEAGLVAEADVLLGTLDNYSEGVTPKTTFAVREEIMAFAKMLGNNAVAKSIVKEEYATLKRQVEFAPWQAIALISISLGIGTMIGWKRIVVTIGEKIGKRHMTYAEGATAELIAASTIGLSTGLGLPVSTTHVLSSGVAGSMTASKGVNNLQPDTIKSIGIAWLLTLPVTMGMAALLFALFRILA
ncbi:MAG: inorganic phosphate transporter [Lewinellaceae bacterium]|nr:inorganic phosphate transporter [Lewinellaceae bacterium]